MDKMLTEICLKLLCGLSFGLLYLTLCESDKVCESLCDCFPTGSNYIAHCSNKGRKLRNIQLPLRTTTLDISHNPINSMDNQTFSIALPYLKRLDATYCNLSVLESGAFNLATNIEQLELSHNELSYVPKLGGILKNLKSLSLNHNNIKEIQSYEFSKLNLQQLDLQHNPIVSINVNSFYNSTIETLSLSWCPLQTTSDLKLFAHMYGLKNLIWTNNKSPLVLSESNFDGLHLDQLKLSNNAVSNTQFLNGKFSVKVLDFSHNILEELDLTCCQAILNIIHAKFSNCNIGALVSSNEWFQLEIEDIDLSFNKLKSLDIKVFQSLPKLKILNLKGNYLTTLDSSLAPFFIQLHLLDLTDTHIVCDCGIKWFKDILNIKKLSVNGLICAYNDSKLQSCQTNSDIHLKLTRVAQTNQTSVEITCTVFAFPEPVIKWQCISQSKLVFSLQNAKSSRILNSNISQSSIRISTDICTQINCIAKNSAGSQIATFEPGITAKEYAVKSSPDQSLDLQWIVLVFILILCVIICVIVIFCLCRQRLRHKCSSLKVTKMTEEETHSQLQLIIEDKD